MEKQLRENARWKIVNFGRREVISFFTLVISKGEHSVFYSKQTNIDWKRGKQKESETPLKVHDS
jgi:hypothetical protein